MMVVDHLQGEGDSWYNFIQRGMSAEVRTAVKENSLATNLRGSKERDRSAEQRNGECHGDNTEMEGMAERRQRRRHTHGTRSTKSEAWAILLM